MHTGRLIEAQNGGATLATYAFDAFEQRVAKTTTAAAPGGASSVHFIHDQFGRLIAEHDGATGAPLREYVWLGLMPVAFVDYSSGPAVTYYVHTDQVMTPQKLTDASGAVVWDRVQDPFGVEVSATGALTQALRFPGQYADIESSLNQNWNRDYDPSLGRYIQSDPIGLMGGINTYAYVEGNPLTKADPAGMFVWIAIPGVCAAGGCEALVGLGATAAWMSTPAGQQAMQNAAQDTYSAMCGRCEPLYAEINRLTDELKKREGDLFEDRLGLPATGPFSIGTHQGQFENVQRGLRRRLLQAAALGCANVNPDAWRMATKGAPSPR